MDMKKVFHEKNSEEQILPEYCFHLEQIYIDTTTKNVSENRRTFKKRQSSDTGNIGHKKQKN